MPEKLKITPYPCKDWLSKPYLLINNRQIDLLEISDHYQKKSGREEITHDLIKEFVKQLDNDRFIPERRKGNWEYYKFEPVYYKDKTYKMVWCLKDEASLIRIRTCHRTKKKYAKIRYNDK